MDSHPLGMRPTTQIDYCRQLVGVRILARWQKRVQYGDEHLELFFKEVELLSHLYRVRAVSRADFYLEVFESWFAAKCADKSLGSGTSKPCITRACQDLAVARVGFSRRPATCRIPSRTCTRFWRNCG